MQQDFTNKTTFYNLLNLLINFMPNTLQFTSHQCNTQDLIEYINYLKENTDISFNNFIKEKYYKEDNNKIIIANLANLEINDLNLTNTDLQRVILKETKFTNCNFTDAILCDADLMNTEFNECIFINTDLRGANLHYTDFNYKDISEETLEINNLSEKINGIKVSFSDIERLNKYIDKDLAKEAAVIPISQAKTKELKEKQKILSALSQNFDNPSIITAFANRFWYNEETIKESRQNNLIEIEKLQKEANALESEIYTLENIRMFCGNNSETIFKQLADENILVQTDPSYIIGSSTQERNTSKTYIKLIQEEFDLYLNEAAKESVNKLSLSEFIKKQKKLSKDLVVIPDLSAINLADRELKNLDLKKTLFIDANLANIKITNCDLRYANFEGANLQNALFEKVLASDTNFLFTDLKGSSIKDSNMSRAYMPKIDLSESEISNSNFNTTIMINADAEKMNIKDTEWNQSNLTGISLAYADMQRVKMQGTILTNGLLDQATIISSDFENAFMNNVRALEIKFQDKCNMKGITAREAYFSDAEFKNVLSLEEADFRKAVMTRVKAVNANMKNTLLDQANLEYVDLTDAILTGASAQFSNLSNIVLNNARAEEIDISDAIAVNMTACKANFKNAIMHRANITKGNFEKSVFENADLECVEATKAIFREANLQRANLKGGNFVEINKEKAGFNNAKIDDGTQLHDTKGTAIGQVEYQNADGSKNLVNINKVCTLKDKIHAREQSSWFLKSTTGQFCTKIAKGATKLISNVANLFASKKIFALVAVTVGLAVVAAPFVACPVLAFVGVGLGAKIAIGTVGVIAGAAVATATYKITQKPLLKLKEASKNLSTNIAKYISPPPEDIDKKVKEAQQTRSNYVKKNEKGREENLNKVNNDIAKSKQEEILIQPQASSLTLESKQENSITNPIIKIEVISKHTEKINDKTVKNQNPQKNFSKASGDGKFVTKVNQQNPSSKNIRII